MKATVGVGKSCATTTVGHILTGVGILVAFILGASTIVYTSYAKSQDAQDRSIEEVKVDRKMNTENIGKLMLDVNTIQGDVCRIKDDIEDSKAIQQKILDKLTLFGK